MSEPHKKQSLIGSKYRLSFMGRFLLIALLVFLLFGIILFVILSRRLGIGYFEDIATLSNLQESLPRILVVAGVIQVIVVGLVVFLLSLCWAHAVSGPLVRVRRYIEMMRKGEPVEDVRFRKGDQLHSLADAFQEMITAGNKQREQFEVSLAQAEQLIQECDRMGTQDQVDPTQMSVKLAALKGIYEDMRERLRRGKFE